MTRTLTMMLLAPALLSACPTKRDEPPPPDPGPAVAVTPPTSSAATPRPWYRGTWQGRYEAKRQALDVAPDAGRIRAWDEDDGTAGVGAGQLELTIDEDGRAAGSGKGALGELGVSGAVEGESVRLRLLPPAGTQGPAFAGYVVADREGERLTGVLKASSGDSQLVRRAEVVLEKRHD